MNIHTAKMTCLFLFIFLLTVGKCISADNGELIGKWQNVENQNQVIEIFGNKTIRISTAGYSVSGKWSFLDDSKVMLVYAFLTTAQTRIATIEGPDMILDYQYPTIEIFDGVKFHKLKSNPE